MNTTTAPAPTVPRTDSNTTEYTLDSFRAAARVLPYHTVGYGRSRYESGPCIMVEWPSLSGVHFLAYDTDTVDPIATCFREMQQTIIRDSLIPVGGKSPHLPRIRRAS